MARTITLAIDDREVTAEEGQTVLEAALAAGIDIPHLCHDPRLAPVGACRMCIVEIEGERGLPTSCTRHVAPGMVVAAREDDRNDANRAPLEDNLRRLRRMTDLHGRRLHVETLPMPAPVSYRGIRLPASYANFYIANGLVMVPTFNDDNDRIALATLARLFPRRRVVGIHATDLVLGQGGLHCITQQQPEIL